MFIVDFLALLLSDLVTVSPQLNVTEEGLIDVTTSPTTNIPWTTSMGTDVTDESPNPTDVTITAGERTTSFTNHTHTSVTSPPATHTDPYHFNSSYEAINPTHSLNTSTFSDQSVASNLSTTLSHDSTLFRSTQETRIEPTGTIMDNPGATNLTTGNTKKESKGNNYYFTVN